MLNQIRCKIRKIETKRGVEGELQCAPINYSPPKLRMHGVTFHLLVFLDAAVKEANSFFHASSSSVAVVMGPSLATVSPAFFAAAFFLQKNMTG